MRTLITGSNGLLGQKIVKICQKRNVEFLATSNGENRNTACQNERYKALDIRDIAAIVEVFQGFKPTHVIHTAALTNVDYCEDHPDECQEVNVTATRLLFEACVELGIHFQLLSTDFVFDGENGPYSETDAVNPLSIYAKSKVDAENILISSSYNNWSIARTIIVYGTGENLSRTNIVLWALEALPKGAVMNIVNDQFRMPTWAEDLAWGCLEICNRAQTGIFHLSGPEFFSMFDLVLKIGELLKCSTEQVQETSSKDLNQAAKRPPRTGFKLEKAHTLLNYKPSKLEVTIPLLLKELKEQKGF
jgi:dTDP-4-dehydrorhamnose reductase